MGDAEKVLRARAAAAERERKKELTRLRAEFADLVALVESQLIPLALSTSRINEFLGWELIKVQRRRRGRRLIPSARTREVELAGWQVHSIRLIKYDMPNDYPVSFLSNGLFAFDGTQWTFEEIGHKRTGGGYDNIFAKEIAGRLKSLGG